MENTLVKRIATITAQRRLRILLCAGAILLLFTLYTWGISRNPPGFYLDESATAFNAYLVSRTGFGELGPRFPLLFQEYAVINPTFLNPLTIYLLAIVFRIFPPSILVARLFAAFWMFAACLLLGVLAKRISGQLKIGIVVAATALLTPWLIEISRLVWDAHFSAFTVVLFLVAAYRIHSKERWLWRDIAMVAGALTAMSYGYLNGRVLAPLYALGLLFFATSKPRFLGVIKVWLVYAVTLVPVILFNRSHAGALTKRLYEVSYIKPDTPLKELMSQFVRCYLQDQSLTALLMTGDPYSRHHLQGSGGAILFATFILAMIGLWLIIAGRWRNPWWRFSLYGLAASLVPGAITDWPFHHLRLMGYAIFLIMLTIPALEWLLSPAKRSLVSGDKTEEALDGDPDPSCIVRSDLSCPIRILILGVLLAATLAQAIGFQITFHREGPKREYDFDAPYKPLYDAAVARPERPIFLENGRWGPAYMHACWYATVEHRPLTEFARLLDGMKPPSGALVLSSNSDCEDCDVIQKSGVYILYKAR